MDLGFKLNLKTPKGTTGRINHHTVSQWLVKHGLKMVYNRISKMWEITTSVTNKQWKEFYKLFDM